MLKFNVIRKRTTVRNPLAQHVVVESMWLMTWYGALRAAAGDEPEDSFIIQGGATGLQRLWAAVLARLGLDPRLSLSTLRPGGATYDYMLHQNVGRLRWRGLWKQERTLEHYLHEGMVWLSQCQLPSATADSCQRLAGLLPALAQANSIGD